METASASCLDVGIRLLLIQHGITNVHALAIPVYERHTAVVIFTTASKVLDVLYPTWKDAIIIISTDGERKMTAFPAGCETRPNSHLVWRLPARSGFAK